jgi:hypothetical protein
VHREQVLYKDESMIYIPTHSHAYICSYMLYGCMHINVTKMVLQSSKFKLLVHVFSQSSCNVVTERSSGYAIYNAHLHSNSTTTPFVLFLCSSLFLRYTIIHIINCVCSIATLAPSICTCKKIVISITKRIEPRTIFVTFIYYIYL